MQPMIQTCVFFDKTAKNTNKNRAQILIFFSKTKYKAILNILEPTDPNDALVQWLSTANPEVPGSSPVQGMVFSLKFESFWLSSGLGRRFSLTVISHWRERRIQNKSGLTVIVGVNEANNQLILKIHAIWIVSVTSDYLNFLTKYMQHRNCFVRELRTNTKISDCDIKDKSCCSLGPSCAPCAGVLLHPLNIHPFIQYTWKYGQSNL
jgi:hypothetical protein